MNMTVDPIGPCVVILPNDGGKIGWLEYTIVDRGRAVEQWGVDEDDPWASFGQPTSVCVHVTRDR